MNFLAHIVLSGNDPQVMVGNFIADFVKGKKKEEYYPLVRKGIELHRAIDDFTDHHPVTLRSMKRIRAKHGKYSGVVIDLFYDHFLAKDFHLYQSLPLKDFSEKTYTILNKHWDMLPVGVHLFLPFMIERNWLLNYATLDGINRALSGLSIRVSFENKMNEAIMDLKEQYSDFENDFREFFPLLMTFAASELQRGSEE